MELKEFVKSAILDIVNGVKEAQEANASGAIIIPNFGSSKHGKAETIHFDMAVEASTKNEECGKAGVSIAGLFSGGIGDETTNSENRISRVVFDMQLRFPGGDSAR